MFRVDSRTFPLALPELHCARFCNISIAQKKEALRIESSIPTYQRFGIAEEEYLKIEPIFEKCGFSKITKVEKGEQLDNRTISYYVEMEGVEPNKIIEQGKTTGNIIFVYLTDKNELFEIDVNFIPVYKNGKVINKIAAYTKLSAEEKSVCQELCEAYIPKLLKSPSTAKFCKDSDYEFSKENGIIKAQGYVDAQNSFGAIIRSNFLLTYDAVKKVLVSLVFDGTKFTF